MPILKVAMGVTASGKSYYLNNYLRTEDAVCLDVYDYQQAEYDKYKDTGGFISIGIQRDCLIRANKRLQADVIEHLLANRDVIVEHTLHKAKRRIALMENIREAVPNFKAEIYKMSPTEQAWREQIHQRGLQDNLAGIMQQEEDIEFPNQAEGWDAIYEVIDNKAVPRWNPPMWDLVEKAKAELREEAARIAEEAAKKAHRKAQLEKLRTEPFYHYCEVCGKKELLTAEEAHKQGWDYPPKLGRAGLLSPRTCGDCGIQDTLWWKVQQQALPIVMESTLTPEELLTWKHIKAEPESLLDEHWKPG